MLWSQYAWEGPPDTNPWFKMDLSKPGLNSSWDRHVEAEVCVWGGQAGGGGGSGWGRGECRGGGMPRTVGVMARGGLR